MIKQRNPEQIGLPNKFRTDIEEYYDRRIVPYTVAPAIVDDNDRQIVVQMKFSMVPRWSKEPKVKFATHNARLESIDEKPTWKGVFVQHHCLIPMTDFIEPIYEGELAGNMVSFVHKPGFLFAAGVWDEWTNNETGEVTQSFAIITSEPPKFVEERGHDRCPVFLSYEAGHEWLGNEGSTPKDLKDFLFDYKLEPELSTSIFRPMKAGWEKRK